jgi:Big-like domain-containing protein
MVTLRLTGLTTGTLYYVSVTAVNTSGFESACSIGASAVAQIDFSVDPSGPVSFGSVNIGSFADQVFTVQNTRGGTVSGDASASAPFSVVSGSPFTLAGSGATQAVTVRFTPTGLATVSTNVAFTANGDSISRLATGSGVDVSQPSIIITSPTSRSTYSTGNPVITLGGTASDAVGVTRVMWFNDRGASGVAVGTTNWTANEIALHLGTNELTAAALNGAGYVATTTLTVVLSIASPLTDDPLIGGTMPIKAIHVTELRDAIDLVRLACGLTTFAWTDPIIPGSTPIKAIHLTELRTALNDAYLATGRTPPTYTDPTAAAGLIIKATHLNELRSSVRALQ